MAEEPIVIDPPDFDLEAAWAPCRAAQAEVVDEDGEVNWGNAFAADPGVVACPTCETFHWAWGKRQRCTKCGFEYPTIWWSRFTSGQSDRGTLTVSAQPPKRPDDPYYMHGWRNRELSYQDRSHVDWTAITGDFSPWQPSPEESAAMASALKGDCKHYRGTRDTCCGAGVNVRQLVGGEDLGWCTRLPCLETFRNRPNGPAASCDRFEVSTPEELAAEEAEIQASIAETMKLFPLMSRIKRENKGKSAQGVIPCPSCNGQLHWSHAKYNGHVWLRCETKDCVHIIE